MLASHEDTKVWAESYKFLKSMDIIPKFRMGDGAHEISNAGDEVFGEEGVRLMCWPHVYRNVTPRVSQLCKINKVLADSVLEDTEFFQWSLTSLRKNTLKMEIFLSKKLIGWVYFLSISELSGDQEPMLSGNMTHD